MFDLLHEDIRVVHEVDKEVNAVGDADEMGLELGAVWMVDVDAAEQSFSIRVTIKQSADI